MLLSIKNVWKSRVKGMGRVELWKGQRGPHSPWRWFRQQPSPQLPILCELKWCSIQHDIDLKTHCCSWPMPTLQESTARARNKNRLNVLLPPSPTHVLRIKKINSFYTCWSNTKVNAGNVSIVQEVGEAVSHLSHWQRWESNNYCLNEYREASLIHFWWD